LIGNINLSIGAAVTLLFLNITSIFSWS